MHPSHVDFPARKGPPEAGWTSSWRSSADVSGIHGKPSGLVAKTAHCPLSYLSAYTTLSYSSAGQSTATARDKPAFAVD